MHPLSRRDVLKTAALSGLAAWPGGAPLAEAGGPGVVAGLMTGARALVETLKAEGTMCVFGIPGAQGNELWDQMKARGLPYLLVTHEHSAAVMADGAARATGRPGVLCVVPGPGITNALTGLGEALLDSVPVVCIAGDVARGKKYRPFQVHALANAELLKPVCKSVLEVGHVGNLPLAVRQAFQLAQSGEPGPVAVVVPYNLLIESHKFHSLPLAAAAVPFDEAGCRRAIALLGNRKLRVGVYAGMGCMDHGAVLTTAAEMLQAPVATSVSGKGVIDERHPLAVGWGYGPQGRGSAERAFKDVDVVLAIGVRYSEVSTGYYSQPQARHLIHVDANASNLGAVMKTSVCVHADAGAFLQELVRHRDAVARPEDRHLLARLARLKKEDHAEHVKVYATCGVDPVAFLLALRRAMCDDGLLFMDVSLVEHWAAEAFTATASRTYFNPTDNQSMGWTVPAALGAKRVCLGKQVVAVAGDGCFLMSAMEVSTAAREGLGVKFFVLDDQAYHYMQVLQRSAYKRTTATMLARLDYAALAKGLGVGHVEIDSGCDLEARLRGVLGMPGPVLVNVRVDAGKRKVRWIEAVKKRYTDELTAGQKARFLARLGARSVAVRPGDD